MRDKITLFELPDNDDRGVSPVIGVILMVAITVILAAVIASFVLGFGDSVNENVQAGADVTENDDGTATVTWISEGTADALKVTAEDGDVNDTITPDTLGAVGSTATVGESGDGEATTTIIVRAVDNSSGTETVISQEEVTVEYTTT